MSRVSLPKSVASLSSPRRVLRPSFSAKVEETGATGRSAAEFLAADGPAAEIQSPARTSGPVRVSGVRSQLRELRTSPLRLVASRCASPTMRSSPRSVLARALQISKRAAAAEVSQRLSARLAKLSSGVCVSSCVASRSVVSRSVGSSSVVSRCVEKNERPRFVQ
jgi:hypothetical protein